MSEHYTDDDVTAGVAAYGDDPVVVRSILDAVAPQIAAQALREAADAVGSVDGPGIGSPTLIAKWLRARAEQVET